MPQLSTALPVALALLVAEPHSSASAAARSPRTTSGLLRRSLLTLPSATLQGRTYTMQHACLFGLRPSPSTEPAGPGQGALEWRGFVDMPGGGNRFTARSVRRPVCSRCAAAYGICSTGGARGMQGATPAVVEWLT